MIHDRRGEAANDDHPQTIANETAAETRGMFGDGTARPGDEPLRERAAVLDSAEGNWGGPDDTGDTGD